MALDVRLSVEADDEVLLLGLERAEQLGAREAPIRHDHRAQRGGDEVVHEPEQLLFDAVLAQPGGHRGRGGRRAGLAAAGGPERSMRGRPGRLGREARGECGAVISRQGKRHPPTATRHARQQTGERLKVRGIDQHRQQRPPIGHGGRVRTEVVAQLQPALRQRQLIQPRITQQPGEPLEPPVERLVRPWPGARQLRCAERGALQEGAQQVRKSFVLGLAPGGRQMLDVRHQGGVCCAHRRLPDVRW